MRTAQLPGEKKKTPLNRSASCKQKHYGGKQASWGVDCRNPVRRTGGRGSPAQAAADYRGGSPIHFGPNVVELSLFGTVLKNLSPDPWTATSTFQFQL